MGHALREHSLLIWGGVVAAILAVVGSCKSGDSQPEFSIELTPAIVERGEDEMFEVTLTITSDSGNYEGATVKVDVVQEETTVIDELMERDVRGALDSFEAIDPEDTGLESRGKRIRWDASGDAARRQQRFTWNCASGVARLYFFVEVAGRPARAPSGATWQVAEPWGELDPNVADIVERELDLAPSTQLEVLPIGCGEDAPDPPPPPPPPDPPADAGVPDGGGTPEGETQIIEGGSFSQYGLSEAGTLYYVRDGALYWWRPGIGETLISEGASIEAAQGGPGPYGFSELKVTPGGAAIVRVGSGRDCLLMALGDVWKRVVCIDDTLDGGELVDRLRTGFAGQGRAVETDDFAAHFIGRGQFDGSLPGGSFLNAEVLNGGTPLQQFLLDLVQGVMELPDLDDATDPRLVSQIDSAIIGARPGIRGRAIDGTVAIYSRTLPVLAWADLGQTGGPIGSPTPPANVFAAGYSNDNQPIGGLTVNRDGDLGYLVKYIDVNGALLAGSGLYVEDGDGPTQIVDLSAGLPLSAGMMAPVANFGGLPAIQYALVDNATAIVNARVMQTGVVGGIWRADGDAPLLLFEEGSEAPGTEPGTLLGPGVRVETVGSMVVNPVGAVAFSALLAGPGVDESNDGAIYVIDGAGEAFLIAREGDPITIGGAELRIDTLDLASGAVFVPPPPSQGGAVTPSDFHGTAVHDTHVVFGAGSDGHGASFTSEGCGKLVYRAGSFATTRDNVLAVVTLPCE